MFFITKKKKKNREPNIFFMFFLFSFQKIETKHTLTFDILWIEVVSPPFNYILLLIHWPCDVPTRHSVLGKGVTNLRAINMLSYIILNNYLENINLQKYFIYIHRSGIYSFLYIYSESHLLVHLGSHCL